MRIVVTRPIQDAVATAGRLRAMGHEAILSPLLKIAFRDGPPLDLSSVQAVIATSANGVRALAKRSTRRDIPLLVVGPQSERAAKDEGFGSVRSADGDGAALARAVVAWLKPGGGPILHAAGNETRGDVAQILIAAGFGFRQEILYDAEEASALPQSVAEAMRKGEVDAVLFYSPRSARVFASCARKASVDTACPSMLAVAISGNAAQELKPLRFKEIRIAEKPNQDAVLACLRC